MCGIVGIWARQNGEHVSRLIAETQQATDRLAHRGPDDQGLWSTETGVVLGHRRLSILDLSAHGHQPMVSNSGRFVMSYNGEVYNFADIRKTLEKSGHRFQGSGDSEVILAAFEQWGLDAVNQFIGMFAIALWDCRDNELHLIRDRIGVKPLYYAWDGKTFCFASELKALHCFSHWQPTVDRLAVGEYLQFGYISSPRSIFQNTFKLKPGHRLTLRRSGDPVIEQYWRATANASRDRQLSDQEYEEELESLLIDACRYRMVSDVPVGVYLSGGIDSSLVAALLAKNFDEEIRTYTIGFKDDRFDESVWAKKISSHIGTRHTEYILDPGEALEIARDWGNLFDEPFGDSSGIPTLLVSRLAGQEVKVVLSADGGDELFGGYLSYGTVLKRLHRLHNVPDWLAHAGGRMVSAIPRRSGKGRSSTAILSEATNRKLSRKLTRLPRILGDPTVGNMFEIDVSHWHPEEIEHLIGAYRNPRISANEYDATALGKMCLWDFEHYLPDDILVKVDRTTMAVSIEGREPLLDHRLAEFAHRLPDKLRQGELGSKHLLKKILYKYVPRKLVDRPKQGFSIPQEDWLRGELKSLAQDCLSRDRIKAAGIFDSSMVASLQEDFYAGNPYLAPKMWSLLAFEMWRERWL